MARAVRGDPRKSNMMMSANFAPRPGIPFPDLTKLFEDPTTTLYEAEIAALRIALARAEALLVEKDLPLAMLSVQREKAADCAAHLTPRQHEIMDLVLAGHPSKNIAADLGISRRTVENHRAAIMKKTGSKSLPALGRFGLAASRSAQIAA